MIKNYMEYLVEDFISTIWDNNKLNMCTCEKCKDDVMSLALNNLKPHYVSSSEGELFTKVESLKQQTITDVVSSVTNAIEIVKKNQRHNV